MADDSDDGQFTSAKQYEWRRLALQAGCADTAVKLQRQIENFH